MPPRKSGDAAPSPEIFISYAGKDRAAAEMICATLEAAGMRCWIAPRNVAPGVPYASELVDAIAAARIVLVVFSRAANRSDGVLNEVELAFNRKRPLFTVRTDESEPKGSAEFYLRRAHWFDAFADVPARLQALPEAVVAALRSAGKRVASAAHTVIQSVAPARAGNLPKPTTKLFGRDDDVARVAALIASSPAVTLWGSGGVGKTRLALAAVTQGAAPKGGAWFVDLAPINDGAGVVAAVASVLGIREERDRALLDTVASALAKRGGLIVLDNCEHLIDACAVLVERALRHNSRMRFLCTSREPLSITGETVFRVEPLALPEGAAATAALPAVQLFLDRAAAAGGRLTERADEMAAIATIVRRLDGIPFAIELAAARARSMPPSEIAGALGNRLRLLTGGSRTAVARQQTLRGTIDWSYQLLSEIERTVLRRLSVFAGGWTTDALATIARTDDLDVWDVLDAARTLTEKSLAALEPDGARSRLLEMTRDYARELLSTEERDALSRRHAEFYCDLATRTRETARAGSEAAYETLRPEGGNLHAAIEWTLQPGGDAQLAAALCGELATFWDYEGTQLEGIRLLEGVVKAYAPEQPTREAASAWHGLAFLRMRVTLNEGAHAAAVRAAALAAAVADRAIEARSLMVIGHFDAEADRADAPSEAFDRALALFRELGDMRGVAAVLSSQADVAWRGGDFPAARRLYDECTEIAYMLGATRFLVTLQIHRAELEFAANAVSGAVTMGREALQRARAAKDRTLMLHASLNLAAYLLDDVPSPEPLELAHEALELTADEVSVFGWKAIQIVGIFASEAGRPATARRYLSGSIAGFHDLGYVPGATEQRVHDRLVAAVGDDPEPPEAVPYVAAVREAAAFASAGFSERDGETPQELLLES